MPPPAASHLAHTYVYGPPPSVPSQFTHSQQFPARPPPVPQDAPWDAHQHPDLAPLAKKARSVFPSPPMAVPNPLSILTDIQSFLNAPADDAPDLSTVALPLLKDDRHLGDKRVVIKDIPKIAPVYTQLMQHLPNDSFYIYDFYPLQCTNCGLRYDDSHEGRALLDFHLDCHFKRARRLKDRTKKTLSRNWYLNEKDWITNFSDSNSILAEKETTDTFLDTATNEDSSASEARKESQKSVYRITLTECENGICGVCGELFSKIWAPDLDDYVWVDAVLNSSQNLVHPACKD
jgi:predicted  nucleic acid-binding Zn-ribbon protein